MHQLMLEEKNPEPKLLYEMKKLQGWFNPKASIIFGSLKSRREIILDQADISMKMLEGLMKPGIFDEDYNYSDLDSRIKWKITIDKEFKKMNVCGIRNIINKSEMPTGCQSVKRKWVFKFKRNGVFRA
jgi:hypothetical protein